MSENNPIVQFFDGPQFPLIFLFGLLFFFFAVGLVFYFVGYFRQDEDRLFQIGGNKLMFYSALIALVILFFIWIYYTFLPPIDVN